MERERWERIEQLSYEALQHDPDSRADFIDTQCGGDDALREEVRTLVSELESDAPFLERPLIELRGLDAEPEEVGAEVHAGDYRLVRRLGRGGMGEVFLARSTRDDGPQTVAVKVIRRGMDSDDVLARFRAERRILSELRHPNIAQIYHGGAMEDGRPYYVMEYVEGKPIDAYCDERRLSVTDRLRLFLRVCAGVQHAHQNLIVHRDLKPGNILVDASGEPKLLDFGIAKVLDPDPDRDGGLTRTEMRVLTPDWAAPEQLLGKAVTAATDCYGLGVLLHHLLTGRRPTGGRSAVGDEGALTDPTRPSRIVASGEGVSGEEGAADAEALAARRGTDVRGLQRRLAGDLDTILLKALQDDPARRYAFAQAFADDVERHLDGRPVLARPDSFAYRAGKFVRRNAWATLAAAASVVGLLAFAVQDARQSRALAEERDRAVEVRDFLLEAFGARGADQGAADTISARQLLDLQAVSLDETYGDRPRLMAEMLGVLAEGYQRLGLFDSAEEHARRSLDLRLAEYGEGHREVAAARSSLGWIRFEQGAFTEADSMLDDAVAAWRALGRGEREGLARALNDRGVVLDRLGDSEAAGELLGEALGVRTELFGDGHRAVAVTASNLAASLYRRGDYAGAAAMGERALDALRSSVGPDHQRSLVAQSNLAVFRWVGGDQEGTEAEYRDLLARQGRVLGASHPVTIRTQQALANFYESTGRAEDGIAQLSEILEAREAAHGPDHPDVAETLEILGAAYVRARRPLEAIPVLNRSLEIKGAVFGDEHEEIAEVLGHLGGAHRRAGDASAAERYFRSALDVFDRSLGADHPRVADARFRLAELLLEEGRPDEAFVEYERTYRSVADRDGTATSAVLNSSRLRMAEILLGRGRLARADALVRETEAALVDVASSHDSAELLARLRVRVDSVLAAEGTGPER